LRRVAGIHAELSVVLAFGASIDQEGVAGLGSSLSVVGGAIESPSR
jgi:hypothetical protein